MTIRAAAAADLSAVHTLFLQLVDRLLPREDFDPIYLHNLERPLIRYLVAEDEQGEVRGFVSLHMEKQLHHAALVGEVQELVVDGGCRSRGIGAALLRAAQHEAALSGCSHLELNSGFSRTRAHAFYERNGWLKDHYNFTYWRLKEDR